MYETIRDFLLEPALYTVGIALLPATVIAAVLARAAPAPGAIGRRVAALAVGSAGSLVGILAAMSGSVLRGDERLRAIAWAAVFLAWLLAWGRVSRHGTHTLWAATAMAIITWWVDTRITEALLFE